MNWIAGGIFSWNVDKMMIMNIERMKMRMIFILGLCVLFIT